METTNQFEQRKRDHIKVALDLKSQAQGFNGLDRVVLEHEALPDLDFSDVETKISFQKHQLNSPIFISSMTAGHEDSVMMNAALARLSQKKQILMGVGSQRRELTDFTAIEEWKKIKKESPQSLLLGNIGITQLISTPLDKIKALVDSIEAVGLFVHLNSLQECLQPEGTPQFRGGLAAIEKIAKTIQVPVIVKEVGCGFSIPTIKRLAETGIYAIDISGLGGTHWGRVEGYRTQEDSQQFAAAQTFANWGISTAEALDNAQKANVACRIWASGGIRNGLEVAKCLAMGADQVGLAQPWMQILVQRQQPVDQELDRLFEKLNFEVKIALFCTGHRSIEELKAKRIWKWQKA